MMPALDLSLPPKPPVPNFSSPIRSYLPQRPSSASQPQYLTPPRSAIRPNSQNLARYLVPVPFPTLETYQLSPSPSLSNQTPLSFSPLQGLPSPSVLPLGGVAAWGNITPSPHLQSPTNGAVAQRRYQRKRDSRMIPSTRSPSYRSPRPRPRLTGKTPPWRIDRRRAYASLNLFQAPEQSRTPLKNMSEHQTSPDGTIRSTHLKEYADTISYLKAEYTKAVNATQQQTTSQDGPDPIRRLIELYLDNGVNYLSGEEQALLCKYIDPQREDQRDLVYRLAEQILWYTRTPPFTYRLANWIRDQDRNHEVYFRLFRERLDLPDPEEGNTMMSLAEVGELMDCQIGLDAYKEWQKKQGGGEKRGKLS